MYSTRNNDENFSSTNQSSSISSQTKRKAILKDKSINMLSVSITTVMLLASRVPNIPEEYYWWTDKYLKCIKDGHGKHPPNVKKILKIIGIPVEDSMSFEDEEEEEKKCKCPQMTPPFWRDQSN